LFSFEIVVSDRIGDVRADWRRLEAEGAATPFQALGWLEPWYDHVAPAFRATPLFVVARDRRTAAPLMLLPLCRRHDGHHDVIEFADLGVSDYNAPLLGAAQRRPGAQADIWAAIRAALPRADLLRMDKLPETVAGNANPLIATRNMHRIGMSAWGVALPRDRAAFDETCLAPTFLKELRRKNRRIEGRGPVSYVVPQDVAQALDMFATLADLRAARFAELGRHNVLGIPACRAFYEQVIERSWAGGLVYMAALDVGAERVAVLFGLRSGGTFHLLMSTFRGDKWKSSSPGNVLIDRAITAMIGEGVNYFDFTIGDEAYKRDFGATETPLYGGSLHLSLTGFIEALKGQVAGAVKSRLRQKGVAQAARGLLGSKAAS
jgi:CelD/BcsL family acetyltransferase involved in cellulose biosynthesis